MVVNKQQSKPCNAAQVNQTTDDRYDKAHGAIALQLAAAPSRVVMLFTFHVTEIYYNPK